MSRTAPPSLWDRAAALGPTAVDLLVFLGALLVALVDVTTMVGANGTGGLRLLAILGAVGALVVRRRVPLGSWVFVLVILGCQLLLQKVVPSDYASDSYPLFTPVAVLSAMVVTLVRRQPTPVATAVGVSGALGIAGQVLLWPMPGAETQLLLVIFGCLYTVGLGAGIYLRDLDRRGALAAARAREDERLDLARELHDVVAHHITGMVIQAQAAQVVAAQNPQAAVEVLARIEGAGKDALAAMRAMVGSLRNTDGGAPVPLAPTSGYDELVQLVANSTSVGLPARLVADDAAARAASGPVASSVHRVVQESLTNARRHARNASGVDVVLAVVGRELVVTVTDDGRQEVGAVAGAGERAGYGLVGMTERAEALGGTLRVGPVAPPQQGWQVEARFPLETAP